MGKIEIKDEELNQVSGGGKIVGAEYNIYIAREYKDRKNPGYFAQVLNMMPGENGALVGYNYMFTDQNGKNTNLGFRSCTIPEFVDQFDTGI